MFKRFSKKQNIKELHDVLSTLELLSTKSKVLAIAPDNTGYSWLGIKNGAIALFPENIICLPQYYSNSIFNDLQIKLICEKIIELGFQKIIMRGFPLYFEKIILNLNHLNPKIKIYLLFGGFLSEFTVNSSAKDNFLRLIEMKKKGFVTKIGFNKNGLAETVNKLYNVDTFSYYNKTLITQNNTDTREINSSDLKIGVLANTDFRKNIDNQVAAALMIQKSDVFVKNKKAVDYLDMNKNRLYEFPNTLPHLDYVKLLHQMKINMYVSFSESWGHVILESLAGGVPCLASNTSSIFDDNTFLKNHLIVEKFDDSYDIYKKTVNVIKNYTEISDECKKHVVFINNKAEEILINEIIKD